MSKLADIYCDQPYRESSERNWLHEAIEVCRLSPSERHKLLLLPKAPKAETWQDMIKRKSSSQQTKTYTAPKIYLPSAPSGYSYSPKRSYRYHYYVPRSPRFNSMYMPYRYHYRSFWRTEELERVILMDTMFQILDNVEYMNWRRWR